MERNRISFQEAVSKAEKLGELAQEAARESVQASHEAISRAEQV